MVTIPLMPPSAGPHEGPENVGRDGEGGRGDGMRKICGEELKRQRGRLEAGAYTVGWEVLASSFGMGNTETRRVRIGKQSLNELWDVAIRQDAKRESREGAEEEEEEEEKKRRGRGGRKHEVAGALH